MMDILTTFALTIAKLALKGIQRNTPAYVHNYSEDVTVATAQGRVYHVNVQKLMQNLIQENVSTNTATNMRVENTIID
jgi:hypothetical protein